MRLPNDWEADRTPGYGEVHYLTHTECGWRSSLPYDLICGEAAARRVVYGHVCEEGRDDEDRWEGVAFGGTGDPGGAPC